MIEPSGHETQNSEVIPSDNSSGCESLLGTFEQLSPLPERAVVGAFMAATALEAAADYTPDKVAMVLLYGAAVLKITGFAVGAMLLTSALHSKVLGYIRRKTAA